MGVDCSTCCTTAEENKSEINDVNNEQKNVRPGQQKFSGTTQSTYATNSTSPGNATKVSFLSLQRAPGSLTIFVQKGGKGGIINTKRSKQDDMLMLTRVQALIRGYLQRKKYKIMKLTSEVQSKYFKVDEAEETLGGQF